MFVCGGEAGESCFVLLFLLLVVLFVVAFGYMF
jgi:hypothetical protein